MREKGKSEQMSTSIIDGQMFPVLRGSLAALSAVGPFRYRCLCPVTPDRSPKGFGLNERAVCKEIAADG